MSAADEPSWSQALAYAVVGSVPDGLRPLRQPEADAVLADLDRLVPGGLDAVRRHVVRARSAGRWPYPIPDDLRVGLGPSQLLAAIGDLQRELSDSGAARVVVDRQLTADERRLLADLPPHHGR